MAHPVVRRIPKHVNEAHQRYKKRDPDAGRIRNRALDRREHGAARDGHDHESGAAAGVRAQVRGSEGEEGGVLGRFEEVEDQEDDDGAGAGGGAAVGVEDYGEDGVDDEEEVGLEDGGEGSADEAADGEGDEGVGEHVGGLRGAVGGVLGGVVDEEGADGYLSANVAELRDESED